MKIWVLFFENFQGGDDFVGVYSSEEKAREKIARYGKEDQRQFRIDEGELDDG